MSEPQQVRRFPFWLTVSVLGNLVLVGLLAGIFLNGPKPGPGFGPGSSGSRPDIELSAQERDGVRELMRESFEAGRESLEARRAAERRLTDILRAETYDEIAARAALAELQAADRSARDLVADRMFEGMDELSPDQRALVARFMAGNMEKRGKRGERLEKFRERRQERLAREGEGGTP